MDTINNNEYIRKLEKELKLAKEKLARYESILIKNGIEFKEKETLSDYTTDEKLDIFIRYFAGRGDVYALRWVREKKSGYSPAYKEEHKYLSKEEKKLISSQELYKKIDREVYYNHLKGEYTLGLYPILHDSTCYFLAVDFDEESWKKDSLAFYKEIQRNGFDALLEISRSGKGAHIWIFFDKAIDSEFARKFGRYILTDTMNNSRSITLNSYDRMFPSQDYVSGKQIGNLIALPLNGLSGKRGNTLFVNEEFIPYENQYEKIERCKKITFEEVKNFIKGKESVSDVGYLASNTKNIDITNLDFHQPFILTVSNEIIIKKDDLNYKSKQFLIRVSSINNPQFYKNEKMRLSNFNVPRIIQLHKEDVDNLSLPVGLITLVKIMFDQKGILYDIDNIRSDVKINKIKTNIVLRSEQTKAYREIRKHENGLIVAPTGFGKTILGIKLISTLSQKTLVITNRVNLCEQWYKRINEHTSIDEIGRFYGKYKDLGRNINIATFQSLMKYPNLSEISNKFGLIVVDEVHHLAAVTFEKVIRTFSSKYMYGFTATPKRADGLERIINLLIGDIIVNVKLDNSLLNKSLITHFTSFKYSNDMQITEMLNKIALDKRRNKMIIEDIVDSYENKKCILVLTDRINHLKLLEHELSNICENLFVVHGRMGVKQKRNFHENLDNVQGNFIILSTGKYIGEGFDDSRLDTLFLTMPFRWKGTLAQYVGRLNRTSNEIKYITVYDYLDIHIKMFSNMYVDRLKGYKQQGFEIDESLRNKQSVFNKYDYYENLLEDLTNAKESVRFIMRYCHDKRVDLLRKNISVSVNSIINKKDDKTNYLNVIIIDDTILWYGSINPFVFNSKEEDTILRIEDNIIIKEVLK